MRRAIAVAAIVLAGTGAAWSENTRDIVARKYGQAMAMADRCPTLRFNSSRGSLYIVSLGVPFDKTFEAVMTVHRNRALTEMDGYSRETVCKTGVLLFGPKGTEAPRLLEKK